MTGCKSTIIGKNIPLVQKTLLLQSPFSGSPVIEREFLEHVSTLKRVGRQPPLGKNFFPFQTSIYTLKYNPAPLPFGALRGGERSERKSAEGRRESGEGERRGEARAREGERETKQCNIRERSRAGMRGGEGKKMLHRKVGRR